MNTTTLIPNEDLQRLANRVESDPLFGKFSALNRCVGVERNTMTSTESNDVGITGFFNVFKPMQVLARILVDSARVSNEQDCSRGIELAALAELSATRLTEQPEQVEFEWTKRSHRIREIARRYSETANADY